METIVKPKILIVDDHAVNVEYIRKMIEKWGYETRAAYRGLQAIKMAQEDPPDLVLLDVIMPDLTGYEVFRALKINPSTRDIPIIYLTAKGEIFDRIEGLDMGASDYIAKPFHPEELKARIKTVLRYEEEKDKLKKEASVLKANALIDSLTGFYNRKYLDERLPEELSRAKRYKFSISLALVSIDDFRELKRVFSKHRVESIIKQIGDIMKNNIRAIDIVIRFDENKYAILLAQTGAEGAKVFGRKIRQITTNHRFFDNQEKSRVSINIGIASYDAESIGELGPLVNEAEKALQTARLNMDGVAVVET